MINGSSSLWDNSPRKQFPPAHVSDVGGAGEGESLHTFLPHPLPHEVAPPQVTHLTQLQEMKLSS